MANRTFSKILVSVSILIFATNSATSEQFDYIKLSTRLTPKCLTQYELFKKGLERGEMWANKMADATSRPPSGLYTGNHNSLGAFYQCVEIKEPVISNFSTRPSVIKGKYCLGNTSPSYGFPIVLAVCVPDQCEIGDVSALFHLYPGGLRVEFDGSKCQTKEQAFPPFNVPAIITIFVLTMWLVMMVASTFYEIYLNFKDKKPQSELFVAFSVYKNLKAMMMSSSGSSSDQLTCLEGLRFISMMWIVYFHTFLVFAEGPVLNLASTYKYADSMESMMLFSGHLAVDTFFVISGLLVVYSHMRANSKGAEFNIYMFYAHKIIRILPPLAMAVLFVATLMDYMGSGPYWTEMHTKIVQPCQEYWWATILFIQNYVSPDKYHSCISPTWYLCVYIHLIILSPIILVPLTRWPKSTLAFLGAILLASIAIPFFVAYEYQLTGIMTNFYGNATEYNNYYYYLTHTRASTFFVGMFLGYIVYKIKKEKFEMKIPAIMVAFFWIVSLIILTACVFVGHSTLRGPDYDRLGNSFYISLIRPAWAMGLSWVILACVLGYGGPVNSFLSLRFFEITGRLTFSIYLVHKPIMYVYTFSQPVADSYSAFNLFHIACGNAIAAILIAIVWFVAFESPMGAIDKVIFPKK